MHKRPLFSIVIPTYNKSEDLKNAINSVFKQTYKDFELIISDNDSSDNTKQIVNSYKEIRIKYFKNSKNIGRIKNVERAINLTKGKYVILQGDDDYLYSKYCLLSLSKIIKNKDYGFVRLNYASNKDGKLFDFRVSKSFDKDMILKAGQGNDKVFNFIQKIDPYFMTGICFINNFNKKVSFIDSELAPWFNILFYNAKKYGAYYYSEHFFIAKWVSKPIHPFYILVNNKFTFEKYLDYASQLISEKEFYSFKKKLFNQVISLFPLAKVSLGNISLVKCANRILHLHSQYRFSLYFWLNYIGSLLTPKFVILKLKEYYLTRIISTYEIKKIT